MVTRKYQKKSVFQQFITDYFETREQFCAFVLIDIRHEAQTIDIEFMSIWEKVKSFLHYFH
jgi:GTP-binding protein EngB required for normal cell division